MKKLLKTLLFLSVFSLFAQEETRIKTPEEIQAELDLAWSDFNTAKEMFIPWYTGPLITGSANNVPAGKWNIQGYLFLNNQYATYDNGRHSVSEPDTFTLQPLGVIQRGLFERLDFTAIFSGFFRWRDWEYSQGYGDTAATFGIQLMKHTPWEPSVRLTIGESFPTGRYQRFKPEDAAIASTGSGAFETQIGLIFNKIYWKSKEHPISVRFASIYTLPNHRINVKGFNSYGGGFGTKGKICAGDNFQADLGIEVSLSQKWVLATDVAYTVTWSSSFKGTIGTTPLGTPASVGGPSSDQLSLAPAIEYNVSSTGGFIAGVWFSVTGRNSPNFVSGVISYTQMF